MAVKLYERFIDKVIAVSSIEVAEGAKILENVYRAVNIAMVNEMKVLFEKMGLDIWEVIDAAATKPFGFQPFYPGPGLGGHCIPIDPFYLAYKAREVSSPTRFIELAGEVNRAMPDYVVQRTLETLQQANIPVEKANILILGIAYKPNVEDVRESPSFAIMQSLRALGANIQYHDPHVAQTHPMRHYPDMPTMHSIQWSAQTIADTDIVIIATHHQWYDWQFLADHARYIVDTRGVMRHVKGKAKVIAA